MPAKPEIRYETKEESNARREREFLALTPAQRFLSFLRTFDLPNSMVGPQQPDKGNFIVRKRSDS